MPSENPLDPMGLSPLERRAIEVPVAEAFRSALAEHVDASTARVVFQSAVNRLAEVAAQDLRTSLGVHDLTDLWRAWEHLGGEGRLALQLDEISPSRLRFHVDGCAYADMYRDAGLTEAGIAFSCRRDKPFAEALIPGVNVEQSLTILEGASRCEFIYTLEDA